MTEQNQTVTAWERPNLREMLYCLIGYEYGQDPENSLNEIRQDKRKQAEAFIWAARLRPQDVALEIGCGIGLISQHLAKRVGRLYCCDISEKFIELAAKGCRNIQNISFHKIVSGKLDFLADQSVDAVVAVAVFIHLDLFDIYWYFQEFKRVVRKGGRVVFDFSSADRLNLKHKNYFESMAENKRSSSPDYFPELMKWNSEKAVSHIANHFGFGQRQIDHYGYDCSLIQFEKIE